MIRRLPSPSAALSDAELLELYDAGRARACLRMNMVTSLDGAVTLDGGSRALSNPDDRRLLTLLRTLADVVLVGAGTLRQENYAPLVLPDELRAWREARGLPADPRLAIVSHRLDLSPELRALAQAKVRPLIITHERAPADRRTALSAVADLVDAEARPTGDGIAGQSVIAALHRTASAQAQVLCEGGPHLFGALFADGAVDELCLSLSPLLTGPGASRIIAGQPGAAVHRLVPRHTLTGDDGTLFVRYAAEPEDDS